MTGSYANRFEHIEELHYFLIGHSVTCVLISIFAYMTVTKNVVLDRRQYFLLLGVSTTAAVIYFIALAYIVATGSSVFTRSTVNSNNSLLTFLEGLLDLLATISRNPFSFFFAVLMNFILLYGIFSLNMCSLYLVEIAKSLE